MVRSRQGAVATAQPHAPIYVRIEDYIRALIGGSGLAPGDRVPSERTLAEQLGASRMTVRKAMERLVSQGVLERDGTAGTRVTRPRVVRPTDAHTYLGIARIVRAGGGTPGNKLLHFAAVPAGPRVARRLAMAEGAEVVLIRRLWTVDEVPFCIETSHLPSALVPGLAAEDLLAGQSLYALLRSRYGLETTRAERLIGVTTLTDLEARLLGLGPSGPALLLELVASDAADHPIEYMASVNHPGRVRFRTANSEIAP